MCVYEYILWLGLPCEKTVQISIFIEDLSSYLVLFWDRREALTLIDTIENLLFLENKPLQSALLYITEQFIAAMEMEAFAPPQQQQQMMMMQEVRSVLDT